MKVPGQLPALAALVPALCLPILAEALQDGGSSVALGDIAELSTKEAYFEGHTSRQLLQTCPAGYYYYRGYCRRNGNGLATGGIVGVIIAGLFGLAVFLFFFYFFSLIFRRRRMAGKYNVHQGAHPGAGYPRGAAYPPGYPTPPGYSAYAGAGQPNNGQAYNNPQQPATGYPAPPGYPGVQSYPPTYVAHIRQDLRSLSSKFSRNSDGNKANDQHQPAQAPVSNQAVQMTQPPSGGPQADARV